jgi:hypothetical protein
MAEHGKIQKKQKEHRMTGQQGAKKKQENTVFLLHFGVVGGVKFVVNDVLLDDFVIVADRFDPEDFNVHVISLRGANEQTRKLSYGSESE